MTMTLEQFEEKLERLPALLEDASYEDELRLCLPVIQKGIESNFIRAEDSERVGWPPHAPATVKKHGVHPLLILTSAMIEAATQDANPGNITEITSHELTTGVDGSVIPYAAVQDRGSEDGHIPQRQFMYATEDVIKECEQIIADGFLEHL